MMLPVLLALIVVVGALQPAGVAAQTTSQSQGSARTREIYVSVLNRDDEPVTGLTAADFLVREDGALREVLQAGRATAPAQIMLLVDDSAAAEPAVTELRQGLTAFVDRLQGHQLGLVTLGDRPTSIAELSSNVEGVRKGVSRLFARPDAGTYFLEGLSDVARGLERREASRPIIVAVLTEGVEFSNPDSQVVLDRLEASRATLHVLSLGTPSDLFSDEMRHRNIVIANGASRTGGRRDQVLAPSALPDALRRLADEIVNQYVVTYGASDALIPPERIEVSVKQPGAKVRARTRVPGK